MQTSEELLKHQAKLLSQQGKLLAKQDRAIKDLLNRVSKLEVANQRLNMLVKGAENDIRVIASVLKR